ncbi:MAG: immunoglobulin domain-containing protein [Verrucomicrobiales bacterium]|nr:immunoglobulin domain-containing protein [Verrucomicrobiales bacterium]
MVGQISGGIYVQARNTPSTTPGYFFHQCQLTRGPGVVDNGTYLARIDPNAGGGFPYSQVVWMNCRMDAHIHAAGWQLNNATTAPDVKFWEYQSVAPDGTTPIVITSRPTYNNAATGVGGSTLLNNQQMDQATRDYFANATNAIGWWPLPTIVTHPSSQSTSPTQMVTFTVAATAPIALTYQWQKDGSNIAGATSATYTINSAVAGDAGSYTCIVTDNAGSVTSNAATLTVSLAPYFTTHPATQTVTSGSVVNFTSAVLDATGVTFQWFKGASAIPGATSNAFSFTAAPADAGSYTVQATNANGTTTSNAAVLTVNYAPVITSQPVGASVFAGQSVTFSVQADALPAATYQWLKNNVAISGATSASYVISSALPSHNGSYTCAITNSVATTTSNAAVLAVTDATAPTIAAPGGGFYPLTLVADAGGQATLPSYANQAATTDNVGVTSVTQSPAAGSVRSLGVTNVTLTAFDAAGLHSSMTFAVNVVPSGSAWPALKVDLGRYSLRSDTAAPHSIEWQFDPAAPSRGYGNVGVLIRKAGAPGAQLDGNWYKAGIDAGALLAMDAVYVKDVTSGNGAVEMVFSGLPAGTHTLATFHNGFNAVTNTPSDISIAVDGVTQIASLTPTRRVMDDADAASAYLTFTATAGVDVVVSFTALGNGSSAAENTPYINGFELDGTNPAKRAKKPTPANDDEHFDGDSGSVQLAWTAGSGAVSHTVYFGTSEATMSALGNQTALTKTVNSLTSDATYYWRVDEVDASSNVTTGDTWRFRIRHLAFPGAEGYGRFARGGRGGSVIEVTNLLDYDTTKGEAVIPGSYRAAIEATGPRTIVFRVSGLIHLKRQCTIAEGNSYVTVAGQTAPGEGICLADYSAGMLGANDVIIRHMRMRLGDASQQAMDGMGQSGSDHTIIDHCSLSWTIDEATSSRGAKNITFQRNIISEALQHSYHYAAADRSKFETHAFAASISGEISSYHHNLIAHCTDRNWSLAGGLNQGGQYAGRCDIRNNVVYNWQARTTDGGVKACNFVNNYYKRGPAAGSVQYLMKPDAGSPTDRQQYYVTGNLMEQTDGSILYENDNWNAASVIIPSGATQADIQVSTPFFPDYCTTHTAREAFRIVLSDVGANAKQDAIDQRIVQETRDGTWHYKGSIATTPADPRYFNTYGTVAPNYNGIIDQPSDVLDTPSSPNAPWPGYPAYDVPADTDHDGIPDWFETAIGSDPAVASNNDDADGDGFTALEDYLNWLADPHALTATNTLATCDLAIHAGGFAAPAFAVGNAVNGSVTLAGSIATFTPGAGFNGRASFDFTITGNGVSVTRTFGICVSPTAAAFERRWIGGSSGNAFSASNWLNGSEITTAQPGNVLIFDSAGAANSTVVLTGTVNPGSVRVDGSTPFVFTGGGSLDASGTVVNNGTMRFIGGTGLSSGGTFINNGLLDIITGSQTLPANFINNGTVLDVSVVRPVSVGLAGGTFDLGIMGYAGHGYQLESSTTLTGTWTPVGGVVSGAGSTLHFQDPAASGMSKFYRVRVAP